MNEHACTFKGGMNKDLSVNDYPNTVYFDAKNLRVITDSSDGLSSSSMVTPKGNYASFTLPSDPNHATYNMLMLGFTVLRDYLIILAHDEFDGPDPDRIYKIALTSITTATNIIMTDVYFHLGGNLIYKADLNFNVNNPIKVVCNYENEDVQKIYWVDGLNTLKHINTIYNAESNDLITLDPELLEILPNHTYGTYTLTESAGGHLKAGRIQYSYQLYSISGTETMFAPPSNLYNLTNSIASDGITFIGNEIETEINKSIIIQLTFASAAANTFDRIRLIALEYEIYNDVPTVRVVAEQPMSTIVNFVDYGNTIGTLTLEEFQVIRNDLIPASIDVKGNYLFAANITQEYFDLDDLVEETIPGKTYFDSRAYRWRYASLGTPVYNTDTATELTDQVGLVGYPAYGMMGSFGPLTIYQLDDSGWNLSFIIGAVATCALYHPGDTLTDVVSINSGITIVLYDGIDWNHFLTLTGLTYFSYDIGTETLLVRGDSYFGQLPSELSPAHEIYPDTDYSDYAVVGLEYTYSFSYISLAANSECMINKGGVGVSHPVLIDNGTGPDYTLISETHDCINTYNNILNDENVDREHEFKYKYITGLAVPTIADLGGTGPYISYEFTYQDITIGEDENLTTGTITLPIIYSKSTSEGYRNPQTVSLYTGYQRDEVYPFALQVFDLKGRPSFTKWIGDIRFPKMSELLNPEANSADDWDHTYCLGIADGGDPTGVMKARALGIRFTIDWAAIEADYPGLIAQLSGFQIVRCLREEYDSTIKASGIILPTHDPAVVAGSIQDAHYSTYQITSNFDYQTNYVDAIPNVTGAVPNSTLRKNLIDFISPEIATNKNISVNRSTDFLQVCGHLDNITASGGKDSVLTRNYYAVTAATVTPLDTTATHLAHGAGEDNWRNFFLDVDGSVLITGPEQRSPTIHTIGIYPYVSRGYNDDLHIDDPNMTYKGTSMIANVRQVFDDVSGTVVATEGSQAMYGVYRRYLGYSIYGGATYQERTYRQYVKASEFKAISATPFDVYSGDTYICPFVYLKLFLDTDAEYVDHSGQVFVTFPVESKINLNYYLNNTANEMSRASISGKDYYLSEKQTLGIVQFPNSYPNIGDLYRYNSAYSAKDISKIYLPKPYDFRNSRLRDTMVTSSDLKYSGEYSDSWLKFKFNNYIELEGEFGGITRILNYNDRLFAFQARGIALLSVLERELVETNNTASLAVGTGGILSRYDYISKKSGTSMYEAICPTESGIYYYDDKNISIYRILESLEAISDTKGMKSYLESSPFTSCVTAYDRANREVLFTPLTGDTLVFSGYLDAFSEFFTFCPTKYITFDKYLLSSLNGNKFYIHNVSPAKAAYNEYYGVYQESSLTLIANPAKTRVVTFHEAEWITDLTREGEDVLNLTFDTLQISNTHQDTGVMNLYTRPDLRRRFRKWRINTFRNSGDSGRIRDSWIKAVFTWKQNTTYKKLVVHPINFMYIPTKVW